MSLRLFINIWGALIVIVFVTQFVIHFDYIDYIHVMLYDPIVLKKGLTPAALDYLHARYLLFIFSRMAAIFIGGGIILRSDFCRKAGILACLIMIILVIPRHDAVPHRYWHIRMIVSTVEILLCSGFVYFFSRPAVVRHFKNP